MTRGVTLYRVFLHTSTLQVDLAFYSAGHARPRAMLERDVTATAAGALVRSLDPDEVRRSFAVACEALLVAIGHADAALASRLAGALRELADRTAP